MFVSSPRNREEVEEEKKNPIDRDRMSLELNNLNSSSMTLLQEPRTSSSKTNLDFNIPSTDPPEGFEEVDESSDEDDDYYERAADNA